MPSIMKTVVVGAVAVAAYLAASTIWMVIVNLSGPGGQTGIVLTPLLGILAAGWAVLRTVES